MATVRRGLWHFDDSAATNDDLGTLCVCVCVWESSSAFNVRKTNRPQKMISALELLPQLEPKD